MRFSITLRAKKSVRVSSNSLFGSRYNEIEGFSVNENYMSFACFLQTLRVSQNARAQGYKILLIKPLFQCFYVMDLINILGNINCCSRLNFDCEAITFLIHI